MRKNILSWPLGDGVEDTTGIAHQVDNLVDIFIFINLVFQPFFQRQVGHVSDRHLDISLIKPGLKTGPSQSDRLDNSGVRTSTSHSTLSYLKQAQIPFKCQSWPIALISWCVWQKEGWCEAGPPHRWEAALVELLQERPGALEEPAKVALDKVRLARISHYHILYCRPVWSQAGEGLVVILCFMKSLRKTTARVLTIICL